MTVIMDDFDYVRAALRRLNPESFEADYTWHALSRIEERIKNFSICAYCGVAFEWDRKGDSCPGCERANSLEEQLETLREAARDFLASTDHFNPERYRHEKDRLIALAWPDESSPASRQDA